MRELTYDWVGATLADEAPVLARRVLSVSFDDAVAALRGWRCHAAIRATVTPSGAPIDVGTEVVVGLGVGPLRIKAPCRIVAVVNEADRFGFAYGTLGGHPERGEESFLIERQVTGEVVATIRVIAEPAWLPLRVVAPLVRALQKSAARRYLKGLEA